MQGAGCKETLARSANYRKKDFVKPTDRAHVRNAFEFVTVTGARARQLLKGCTPRTEGSAKPARLAQKEVLEGKVEPIAADAAAE